MFIDLLLDEVREFARDNSSQREDIFHSFIGPMKVNSISHRRRIKPSASLDLWTIDERLTFGEYVSSDIECSRLTVAIEGQERPDDLTFDEVHGLRQSDALSKVMLIGFERAGRRDY
ncbi:ylh [Rubellimicrobium mesophilum DSM 19309]|uniref:Ylh n=1 Tax=Rubellimicrobium mesophilum DSM 19309 TaxID=442562 RepID=A0A017HKH9_9RHOB|nr:hypothetical protein [Rubellimicrobium mesophilum]EYD74835.1 ylh [Rubellimicrobium mesophilum DSM 19309]